MNADKYYAHLKLARDERRENLDKAGFINIHLSDKVVEKPKLDFLKQKESIGPHCDIKIKLSNMVEEIAHRGLSDSQIVEVIISENGLKKIGDKAFAGSSICAITIPESVEEIGTNVFDGCKYLTEIINLSKQVEITPEVVGNCPNIQFENSHIKPVEDEIANYKR